MWVAWLKQSTVACELLSQTVPRQADILRLRFLKKPVSENDLRHFCNFGLLKWRMAATSNAVVVSGKWYPNLDRSSRFLFIARNRALVQFTGRFREKTRRAVS